MPSESILQLGAVAVIFLFAVREFFGYLKSRKEAPAASNGSGGYLNQAILKELQTMNTNHLHSLQEAINDGNNRIVDAINNGNIKQIELLGEIKGKLENR